MSLLSLWIHLMCPCWIKLFISSKNKPNTYLAVILVCLTTSSLLGFTHEIIESWWTRAHTDVFHMNIHGMQLWTAGILRDCDVSETLREWHESSSTSANAQTQGPAITISCSEFHISSSNTGSSLSRAHSGSQVPPLIPIVHRSTVRTVWLHGNL